MFTYMSGGLLQITVDINTMSNFVHLCHKEAPILVQCTMKVLFHVIALVVSQLLIFTVFIFKLHFNS